jgi:hypothetical protein
MRGDFNGHNSAVDTISALDIVQHLASVTQISANSEALTGLPVALKVGGKYTPIVGVALEKVGNSHILVIIPGEIEHDECT